MNNTVRTQSGMSDLMTVPLTIGITGHRDVDPQDIALAQSEIKNVLNHYRRRFPNTPIVFMSALAEGADQFSAAAALEVEGVSLAAILPMPPNEYAKDFATPSVLQQFNDLLSRSEWCHVTADHDGPFDGHKRDLAYRECGRYIAKSSHILLAIWNEENNGLIGGTADIITYKLRGCVSLETDILEYTKRNEIGFIYHIPVKRLTSKFVPKIKKAQWLWRDDQIALHKQQAFPPDAITNSINQYNSESSSDSIAFQDLTKEPHTRTWLLHKKSDVLASKYQKTLRKCVLVLFGLGVFGILASQLNDKFHAVPSLLVEILVISMMWLLWLYTKQFKIKEKYEDYRGLAEAARTQHYWSYCGVAPNSADYFLATQNSDLDWLRRALRSAIILDSWENRYAGPATNEKLLAVKTSWLQDQVAYFAGSHGSPGSIINNTLKAAKVAKYSKLFFLCGALVILATGSSKFFLWLNLNHYASLLKFPVDVIINWGGAISAFALACAAASKAFGELMAFDSQSRRFQSMLTIYKRALEAFDDKAPIKNQISEEQYRLLLTLVGKEALAETSDWLITKRERKLKPKP